MESSACRNPGSTGFPRADGRRYLLYEVKMIKPSRWIFEEELLYRYKLNREEAVFFDDSAASAKAACRFGLHGISLQVMGMPVRSESLLARLKESSPPSRSE